MIHLAAPRSQPRTKLAPIFDRECRPTSVARRPAKPGKDEEHQMTVEDLLCYRAASSSQIARMTGTDLKYVSRQARRLGMQPHAAFEGAHRAVGLSAERLCEPEAAEREREGGVESERAT